VQIIINNNKKIIPIYLPKLRNEETVWSRQYGLVFSSMKGLDVFVFFYLTSSKIMMSPNFSCFI